MPLEFTPVLGILIGVVLTLFVIALVIILVLRLKYKTSVAASRKRYSCSPYLRILSFIRALVISEQFRYMLHMTHVMT